MKISVVMATYNGEKYLKEQLESIRIQTVQPDEVILCDDCSKDHTVSVVKRYISHYNLQDRWHIIVNSENLGYANNFNKAALRSSGDIIFFADQDDLWLPQKIQKMLNIMEEYTGCQVLCTDYEPFSDGANTPKPPKKVLRQMPNDGSLEKVMLDKKSIYLRTLGCCMCVRRTFYQEVQRYWFDGWAQDDRMWRLAQCVDGLYVLHENLVKHRLHGNNASTYGKYHTREKRIKLFKDKQKANGQMIMILSDHDADKSRMQLITNHIEMMKLRLGILENKNFKYVLKLVGYLPYYEVAKSMGVEVFMAIKGDINEKKSKNI